MTQLPPTTLTHDHSTPERGRTLADRLHEGEEFAVTFGGQGTDWFATLRELFDEDPRHLPDRRSSSRRPTAASPLSPASWPPPSRVPSSRRPLARGDEPRANDLTGAASRSARCPAHAARHHRPARDEGLDLAAIAPIAAVGHSQGILGVAAFAGRREAINAGTAGTDSDVDLMAIARLIGAAATIVGRRAGLVAHGQSTTPHARRLRRHPRRDRGRSAPRPPTPTTLAVVSAVNGPRRVVVSGTPSALRRLRKAIEKRADAEAAEIEAKTRGGRAFNPTVESLPVALGFHHPALAPAVDLVRDWAEAVRPGLRPRREPRPRHLRGHRRLAPPLDRRRRPGHPLGRRPRPVHPLGQHDRSRPARPRRHRRSRRHRGGPRRCSSPPAKTVREAADWSPYAPGLIDRGDGKPVVDTAFTRLTGKSPILLAGMTPTTVDPEIVAAAANAGHWAELAGGGQVSEEIFDTNVARLTELLDEGRTAQFNTLFLDPYLWKMQVGGQRLLQKARQAGAPFDGLVISAGIPDLEDAVAIIEDLHEAGIAHVVFKPGTVKQIRQVVAIAKEVETPVIAHIEGGVAGGHHSWEDLDELLLATYAELRNVDNLVVCVGGGIGTPERAVDYLTGQWATAHGEAAMPVDGVLVGTAAMATKEATTSESVKDLLVATPGITRDENGGWVGAGRSAGDVTSGRSQLGADIHEIDNAASRCGALLDQVAGDAEAAAARKDELIAAMAPTSKVYFGDVAEMTYEQWLRRYLELAGPRAIDPDLVSTSSHGHGWLDTSLERFELMLDRTVARVHPAASGPIERLTLDQADPDATVDQLVATYPEAATCVLHPADVPFFTEVCRRPGKPVNFVPVIDADVRRWWRSDSLWQAHDEAYDADQVIVIPGPVAVAGITTKDEPVADLLDRFEAAIIADLESHDVTPQVATSRTTVGEGTTLLEAATDSHDVVWAGRVIPNPLHRLEGVTHSFELDGSTPDSNTATLRVPLTHGDLNLAVDLSGIPEGRLPVISESAASAAMGELLALTAGGHLPEVTDGTTRTTRAVDPGARRRPRRRHQPGAHPQG